MDDYVSIFTEATEDMGIQFDSYELLLSQTNSFLDTIEKYIGKLNNDPTNVDMDLSDDIKNYKAKALVKCKAKPIELKKIKMMMKKLTSYQTELSSTLQRFAKLKDKIAYGGDFRRAIIRRPKVYSKEISEEAYSKINEGIRTANRAMDWVEKVIIDLHNLVDQDLNILEIVDTVYNRTKIFESYKLPLGVVTEEIADSVVPMLPGSMDEASWNHSTMDKKSGSAATYIKRNHDMASYGEDEPDDYKRPSAKNDDEDDDIPEEPKKEIPKNTKPDEEPSIDEPANASNKGVNNYYYYTYNNSLNKTRSDDHSVHNKTINDDHSVNKHINSDNKLSPEELKRIKDDDGMYHKLESAPWELDLKFDNSDIFTEDTNKMSRDAQDFIVETLNKDAEEIGKIGTQIAEMMPANFCEACYWSDCNYGFECSDSGLRFYATIASVGNYDYEIRNTNNENLIDEMKADIEKYVKLVTSAINEKFSGRYTIAACSEDGEGIDKFFDGLKKYIEKYGHGRVSNSIGIDISPTEEYLKSITPDDKAIADNKTSELRKVVSSLIEWMDNPTQADDKARLAYIYLFPFCDIVGISQDELDKKITAGIKDKQFKPSEDEDYIEFYEGYEYGLMFSLKKNTLFVAGGGDMYNVNNYGYTDGFWRFDKEGNGNEIFEQVKSIYNELTAGKKSLLESVLVEDGDNAPQVGDADDDKPKSDHPIRDVMLDIDQKSVKVQQKAKKAVQGVIQTGKAIAKPVVRTKDWISNMVMEWRDKDETKVKEKMADPQQRKGLVNALRKAIRIGALAKAGILLNPIFIFLTATKKIGDNKKSYRLRNEMIGELKNEMEIIDEKIKQAESSNDYKAKYKLMRFKNEMNKKLLRVGGGSRWDKVI